MGGAAGQESTSFGQQGPGSQSQAASAAQRLQVSQDRIKQLGASSGTELLAATGGRWQGEKLSRNPLSP